MTTYQEQLKEIKIVPNIVIKLNDEYYSIRQPDSGLEVDANKIGVVSSLTLNPTQIDPFRPSVSQSNYSFKLLDRQSIITSKFGNNPAVFQNQKVEIFVGRSGVGMDFDDYLKLPETIVNKVSKQDTAYTFSCIEIKERISNGSFSTRTKLDANILPETSTILLQDATLLPTSGFVKIDQEFISYTGKSGNNLTGCVRGEFGSVAASHKLGSDVYKTDSIQANPIDILLRCLISSGGGGVYDVLNEGSGIDQNLIDVAQFEEIRAAFFNTEIFLLRLFNVADLRKTLEEEILFPLNLRFRTNENGKIGLAVLDRNILDLDVPELTNDVITKNPDFEVDNNKITNVVRILWDYNDSTGEYQRVNEFVDPDSITLLGRTKPLEFRFKAIKNSLSGLQIVTSFANIFLSRFSLPRPTIQVNAFLSTSGLLVGDKPNLFTDRIPDENGDLNFGSTVEIIERSVNYQTGDVRFKLSFNSFTGLRQCFLAPSDTIVSFVDQKTVNIGAGRGTEYRVGWVMRLYDNQTRDYVDNQNNAIQSINGDQITFVDDWDETLINNRFRLVFSDYDFVTEQQKLFCFISDEGSNFDDNKKTYTIGFQ